MESDIKIFDSNGKALNIGDVISRFMAEKAKKYNLEHKEVAIYLEDGALELSKVNDEYAYVSTLEDFNGL